MCVAYSGGQNGHIGLLYEISLYFTRASFDEKCDFV